MVTTYLTAAAPMKAELAGSQVRLVTLRAWLALQPQNEIDQLRARMRDVIDTATDLDMVDDAALLPLHHRSPRRLNLPTEPMRPLPPIRTPRDGRPGVRGRPVGHDRRPVRRRRTRGDGRSGRCGRSSLRRLDPPVGHRPGRRGPADPAGVPATLDPDPGSVPRVDRRGPRPQRRSRRPHGQCGRAGIGAFPRPVARDLGTSASCRVSGPRATVAPPWSGSRSGPTGGRGSVGWPRGPGQGRSWSTVWSPASHPGPAPGSPSTGRCSAWSRSTRTGRRPRP